MTSEVQAQVQKVLASDIFVNSERLCRFLRFAVDAVLVGQPGQLKEYTLALEVFDRPESYDPQVDSLVRVEARRLRSKLRRYYATAGRNDPIVIELPEGSYAPVLLKAKPQTHTIAVLPFVSVSTKSGRDFFCDGMTEEMIKALAGVEDLNVVARTSVYQFQGKTGDVRDIGKKLGANSLLEGSVRRAGSRLRIAVHLVDAESGHSLWSETFDRRYGDLFAIQDEIAESVANTLKVRLRPVDHRAAGNVEAYTAYMKGRYHWNKQSGEGFRAAIREFERAVSACPDCAVGYAGLADTFAFLGFFGLASPAQALPKAKAALNQALRLDEQSVEAQSLLAAVTSFYDWNWEEGERLFRRALELRPPYAFTHNAYGNHLAALGRFEEAEAELQKAIQMEPFSLLFNASLGRFYYFRREYEKATEQCRETLDLDPQALSAWFYLALASARASGVSALGEMQAALGDRKLGSPALGFLGQLHGFLGHEPEARKMLRQLDVRSARAYVPALSKAHIHASLNDWGQALACLEIAFRERAPELIWLSLDPLYDPIRSDPRFQRLLTGMGLGAVRSYVS